MATINNTQNVQTLILNKVPNEATFSNMVDNNQVYADQIYLIEDNTPTVINVTSGSANGELTIAWDNDDTNSIYVTGANGGTVTNIATGGGLTGGPITSNGTISHADTSSQASVNASGRRYITGVTLDTYGHVTGLSTGTETVNGTVTKVTAGTGLSIGTTAGGNFTTTGTINHTNSVTAQATQAVYPIQIDAQGHISGYGSAVTVPLYVEFTYDDNTGTWACNHTYAELTNAIQNNVPLITNPESGYFWEDDRYHFVQFTSDNVSISEGEQATRSNTGTATLSELIIQVASDNTVTATSKTYLIAQYSGVSYLTWDNGTLSAYYPSGNHEDVVTAATLKTDLGLSSAMLFKGSLGTGGTITSLPTAAAANQGYTYKVITADTYASKAAKVGDVFVSTGSTWELIPSGDEPSGTVTSITLKAGDGIALDTDNTAITTSGTRTITNSGVRATTINGNYLRVNTNGTNADLTIPYATTAGSANAVALSSVTNADDLKAIEGLTGTSGFLKKTAANTWTLDTSTYLTSYTETDPTVPSWAKASSKPSYALSEITDASDVQAIEALTGTAGILKKTAANTWTLDTTAYTTNTGTVTQVTAGTGLSIGTTAQGNFTTTGTINHTNSVTAQNTQAIYPIKIDAQGHISAYGSAVTPLTASSTLDATKLSGTIPSGCYTNTTYTFDGTYNASSNKAATVSTVTNAINNLDVSNITGFGAGKTLASLTETDGKIAATFQNISITTSQISDMPTVPTIQIVRW